MASYIILFSAALFAGNTNAFKIRIFNGNDAKIEDFPYQVSLRFRNQHFCGASIISERHILTAAHCILHYMVSPYSEFAAVTGTSYRFTNGGSSHKISKIAVHPKYIPGGVNLGNDIAIITLNDTIVFDEYQQKINLPEKNYNVGQKAIFTGWGLTQQSPKINPNQLQMIETKLISMKECQQKVVSPEKTTIYETGVCAIPRSTTGTCHGDSGGPLVVDGELVGIGAWVDGPQCAIGRPDGFTNVYKFIDFIKSVMNQTE